MSVLEAQPLGIALKVQQSEQRWRAWDRWLADLRRLGDLIPDLAPEDARIVEAVMILVNGEMTQDLHARFETYRGFVLEARDCLGDDHPLTTTLQDQLLIVFRDCWVWHAIMRRVSAAIREADGARENLGIVAHEALVLGYHDLVPAMTASYASTAPSDALKLDQLVELAARLLVRRDAGDTGIRLHPSQRHALGAKALESECSIPTVLREELPSACALELADLPDPMDLKRLRKAVMAIVAPRPKKRKDRRETESESTVMAPPRASVSATGADGMPIETEAPSAEQALLSNLDNEEALARTRAAVAEAKLPPKMREVVMAILERYRLGDFDATSKELGEDLGKSASTVRVQRAQVRAHLSPLRDRLLGSG